MSAIFTPCFTGQLIHTLQGFILRNTENLKTAGLKIEEP